MAARAGIFGIGHAAHWPQFPGLQDRLENYGRLVEDRVTTLPAAAVSNSGANYVWATVPAGATTGPITVTTPGGTNATKAAFTVQ